MIVLKKSDREAGLFTTSYGGREIIGKRDAYTKHFINPDGAHGLVQSYLPIHFTNEIGDWVTYSEKVVHLGDHKIGIKKTDMPVFVNTQTSESVFSFDNSGGSITFLPIFSMSYIDDQRMITRTLNGNAQNIEHQGRDVIWRDTWNTIDRKQTLGIYDIETDYVIKQKPVFDSNQPVSILFTEHIVLPQGWTIVTGTGIETPLGWSGELILLDNKGNKKGVFETPVYYDNHKDRAEQSIITGAYSYQILNGIVALSVVVDVDWLLSDNRVYPIVIDPVVFNSVAGNLNVGPTTGSSSSCQHSMNINVPAGIISVVETTFPMQTQNSGWASEQRANFGFNGAFTGDLGPFCNVNSGGTCTWQILGYPYIVHAGGNISAVLQPWRTWASSAATDICNQHNQRILSSWFVYVGYAVQAGNEITYDWIGNIEQAYRIPAGYCQAKIEVWGAGGGGGGVFSGFLGSSVRAGGGGGGAYAETTISVAQNDELIILVGGGGNGGVSDQDGFDGSQSYVIRNSTTLASAGGGQGGRFRRGNNNNGTKNGTGATTGVNKLFNGGNGGPNNQSHGSGGGGGAGNAANGGNGSATAAGLGGNTGGGNGGAHQESNANGNAGFTPGGGGGGAKNCGDCGSRNGGRGGDGLVKITLIPNPADGSLSPVSPTTICLGNAITVSASGGVGNPRYWIESPIGAGWNIAQNQASNAASNGYTFTPTTPGVYRIHARWQTDCGFCWDIPGHDWNTNNMCPNFAFVDFVVQSIENNPGALSVPSSICVGTPTNISNVTPASTGTPASSGPNYYFYYRGGPSNIGWVMYDGPTSNTSSPLPSAVINTPGQWFVARNSEFGCSGQANNASTVNIPILVLDNNTVSGPSSMPMVCIGNSIPHVTHTTTGATGIGSATGLPSGVTASWNQDVITLSGTPTQAGTFHYSIPLTGGCGSVQATGTLTVLGSSTHAYLVDNTTATAAVEQCEESGWTYYTVPGKPDEFIFGIYKNGNIFDASVQIVDEPNNNFYESSVSGVRGTWLMGRYWNVTTSNIVSMSNDMCIRFFISVNEIEAARSAAENFTGLPGSSMTPLTFFKAPSAFDPTMMVDGNFTFTPSTVRTIGNADPTGINAGNNNEPDGYLNGVAYYDVCNIASFSGGGAGFSINDGSPALLPVALLSFTATAIDNTYIRLDWKTATEINNEGFNIERSLDGTTFETIGWLSGAGNSTQMQTYRHDDYEVSSGIYYYRLKQIDYDGAFEYSPITSARLMRTQDIPVTSTRIRPNPAQDKLYIDIKTSQETEVTIYIYDITGAVVREIPRTEIINESTTFYVGTRHLFSGVYFVRLVYADGTSTIHRLVIAQ